MPGANPKIFVLFDILYLSYMKREECVIQLCNIIIKVFQSHFHGQKKKIIIHAIKLNIAHLATIKFPHLEHGL